MFRQLVSAAFALGRRKGVLVGLVVAAIFLSLHIHYGFGFLRGALALLVPSRGLKLDLRACPCPVRTARSHESPRVSGGAALVPRDTLLLGLVEATPNPSVTLVACLLGARPQQGGRPRSARSLTDCWVGCYGINRGAVPAARSLLAAFEDEASPNGTLSIWPTCRRRRSTIPAVRAEQARDDRTMEGRAVDATQRGGCVLEIVNSVVVPRVEMPHGQRILITGGTGFIGTALTERLCAENEVVVFDRNAGPSSWTFSRRNGHRNTRLVRGDILDPAAVAEVLEGVDSVIHLAAIVGVNAVRAHPRETIETNFLGTLTLLRAVERLPAPPRVVYFSTSEVFGMNSFRVQECMSTSIGPVQETRWSYSISKLAGEHLLQCYHREAGLPTVTIRPFNVFGPGRIGDHAILRFVLSALRNDDLIIHGAGDQIRSWCYIDDFVDGVLAALVRPAALGQDFNLGNPLNTLTIYELAKRVVSIAGSLSNLRFVQTDYADIDIRVPNMEKARRLLGFEPKVDLDEGIRRTAVWCHERQRELRALMAAAPTPVCAQRTAASEPRGIPASSPSSTAAVRTLSRVSGGALPWERRPARVSGG
jgi:UDP-glucose 4-epimerase